ncbi:ATP-binding protein [Candidatus Palauibacter sp.]|uniref:ATP-binding protein n=1 Tax=Candidatus Palauibacter sp. TaxID=3101350 RepID=UPI003B5B1B5A
MATNPTVGGDLLRLITAGMYDNPLILYREYLQNAADAIAAQGGGGVHVMIDRIRSQVAIRDDGTGLSPREAARRLIDVGRSGKAARTLDRGFRGIGRLSALAFAEQVQFTTRTCATEPVTEVTWSGRALRDPDLAQVDVTTAIERCTTIRQLLHGDWPERFFDVRIDRIHRHAASALLNEDNVRSYIGEVCPVPMANAFPLANRIREFLATHTDYFVLDVRVNGDDSPVRRPFGETIPLTDKYGAAFERLETRVIPKIDGNDPAAIVWMAHTPYAGSIPRGVGVRGLRARAGNIQVGSDRIFEHLFLEPRFNGWCVGEVHILDNRIVPNGRRDYFEPSPHQRNLENHIGAIAHEISSRCRRASSQRNKLRHIGTAINRLRRARDFAVSGYLRPEDAIALVERERQRIPEIKQILTALGAATSTSDQKDLARFETQLANIEVNRESALNGVSPHSVATIQAAFGAIAETLPPDSAYDMVETILRRLSG